MYVLTNSLPAEHQIVLKTLTVVKQTYDGLSDNLLTRKVTKKWDNKIDSSAYFTSSDTSRNNNNNNNKNSDATKSVFGYSLHCICSNCRERDHIKQVCPLLVDQ